MLNQSEIIKEVENKYKMKNGDLNAAYIRRDWFLETDLYKSVVLHTPILPKDTRFSERYFWIKNDLTEYPKCEHCGYIKKRFISMNKGYRRCHNNSCWRLDISWINNGISKKIKSNNEFDNFLKYLDNDNFVSKNKEDLLIFKNIFNKNERRFNCANIEKFKDFYCSIIKQTEEILPFSRNKKEVNLSERLYLILNELKEVPKCCCGKNRKYENIITGYTQNCSNKCRINAKLSSLKKEVLESQKMIISSDNCKLKDAEFEITCLKCNQSHKRPLTNARWKDIYCPVCYGDTHISKEEKDVLDYIKTICPDEDIKENYKIFIDDKKQEIDIFIPDKKLAIEYNGILWHSFGTSFPNNADEETKTKNKSLKKTTYCREKDIDLLHINCSEWNNSTQRDIWKSIISNKLGKSEKIFARKCKIKTVNQNDADLFLHNNHLQGTVNCSLHLGLFYCDKLISLMSFSKSRFNKKYEYELVRFCNKKFHTVIGGASKLFKEFLKTKNPKNIISYADKRYSNGNLYKQLNFNYLKDTTLGYFYFKGLKTISRVGAQKFRLKDKLEIYNPNLTEKENLFNNGYRRVWNCGNMIFEYNV